MLGLRTCSRGRVLVVLAVLAVAAIALVPRGLVRAAAASQLPELPAAPDGVGPPLDADANLPGVRALIAREEQDAAHLVIRLVTSSPADDAVAAVEGAPSWPLPADELTPPVCPDPPLACGSRAPPRSI